MMSRNETELFHKILAGVTLRGRDLWNLIFPLRCIACGRRENPETALCESCRNGIPLFSTPFCAGCERRIPNMAAACCFSKKTALRGLGIAASYENPVIKKAVWSLKYRGVRLLAEPLAEILAEYAKQTLLPHLEAGNRGGVWSEEALLVPIPLHPRRERLRGFNQSELIAEILGRKLNIAEARILRRVRYQKPQAEISNLQKRRANIAGAFSLSPEAIPLTGKILILVDDVATTGATLEEAARTLRAAGARKIYGLVLCRG